MLRRVCLALLQVAGVTADSVTTDDCVNVPLIPCKNCVCPSGYGEGPCEDGYISDVRTCYADASLVGTNCAADLDCSGHGSCDATRKRCLCDFNYRGSGNCSQLVLSPAACIDPNEPTKNCSGHGKCVLSAENFKCECDFGYIEDDCSEKDPTQFWIGFVCAVVGSTLESLGLTTWKLDSNRHEEKQGN